MWIKEILLLVVFRTICEIILYQLLKMKPDLLSPLLRLTQKWRGKQIYKWIGFIIITIPVAVISVYFDWNYILNAAIVGLILTICDFTFREPRKVK